MEICLLKAFLKEKCNFIVKAFFSVRVYQRYKFNKIGKNKKNKTKKLTNKIRFL